MEAVVYEVFVGPEIVLAAPSGPDREGGMMMIRPVRAERPDDGWLEAWMPTAEFDLVYRRVTPEERELVGL